MAHGENTKETLPREHLDLGELRKNPQELHSRGVEKILPLGEVMAQYQCGYGGTTWHQWLNEAEQDPRVRSLMGELESSGKEFFQEPITLGYFPEEVDEEGDVYPEEYAVLNGMHRFAAYHFLERAWGYFSLGRSTKGSDYYITITLMVERKPSDGDLDRIWEKGSWRVGSRESNPWVTMETCYGDPEKVEILLATSPATEEALEESLPQLLFDVRERLDFLIPRSITVALMRMEESAEHDFQEVPLAEVSSWAGVPLRRTRW